MSLILSLDTATSLCACALWRGGGILACSSADIGKGHGEYLMEQIDGLLEKAGVHIGDIVRLGVGCGPGSFTGIRVGVAAARGLALALGVPAVGISRFAAVHYLVYQHRRPITVVLQGFGLGIYAQHFDAAGHAFDVPFHTTLTQLADSLSGQETLSGTAAAAVSQEVQAKIGVAPEVIDSDPLDEVCAIAALAANALPSEMMPPVPLYLRPVNAQPQKMQTLTRQN